MRPTRSLAPLLALALAVPVGSVALAAHPAGALPATTVVDTWDDELNADGDCSLREAVETVNDGIAEDACAVAAQPIVDVPGGLFLLDAPLLLTTTMTFQGLAPISTSIDCGAVVGDCIDSVGLGADVLFRDLSVSMSDAALVHSGPFSGGLRFDHVIAWSGSTGFVNEGGSVELVNGSSLWGAQTAGIVTYSGNVSVHDSVIGGTVTAAVDVESGSVEIGHSTIYDNDGFAIDTESGTVAVVDSTITGTAFDAVRTAGGDLSFESSTIAGNGRAFTSSGGAVARFTNTVVADHDLGSCDGPVVSLGFNVADDDTCSFDQASDRNAIDPRLGALDVLTTHPTIPLLDDSPLIDAGGNCLVDDQLHVARPLDGDGDGTAVCDIGAVEHAAVAPVDPTDPDPVDPTPDPEPARPLPAARAATPVSARPAFTG